MNGTGLRNGLEAHLTLYMEPELLYRQQPRAAVGTSVAPSERMGPCGSGRKTLGEAIVRSVWGWKLLEDESSAMRSCVKVGAETAQPGGSIGSKRKWKRPGFAIRARAQRSSDIPRGEPEEGREIAERKRNKQRPRYGCREVGGARGRRRQSGLEKRRRGGEGESGPVGLRKGVRGARAA